MLLIKVLFEQSPTNAFKKIGFKCYKTMEGGEKLWKGGTIKYGMVIKLEVKLKCLKNAFR